MGYPFYLVDAFVDKPFSGNPAGVCVLPEAKPASWMQQVAGEINQSETAFVWRDQRGGWQLRWFTPITEVDLCGHATLASAHALWEQVGESATTLEFHTHSGLLTASQVGDAIQLNFPADPPKPLPAIPPEMAQALGAEPVWVGEGRYDLVAVLGSAAQVQNLAPDFSLIAAMTRRGLIVTAPGDASAVTAAGDPVDMVSRFFAPSAGIDEDPVTGSAHCLLAVYWGDRLDKHHLRAMQASARTGVLMLDWNGDRVLLTGKARTVLTGAFHG